MQGSSNNAERSLPSVRTFLQQSCGNLQQPIDAGTRGMRARQVMLWGISDRPCLDYADTTDARDAHRRGAD